MIYLDNASTTKPYKEVLDIYNKYSENNFFNPSSIYKAGKNNFFLEEKIKENILKLLFLKNKKIIFTSSATEANNLAILGFLQSKRNKKYHILTTKIEHKSILNVFKKLENVGFEVTYLNVNKYGEIDLEELENNIKENTIFASIMTVNNELGNIINIKGISEVLKKHNVVLHSDAAQSFLKTDLKLLQYPNMLTISSHKIHGLKSIAALIIDNDIQISPILIGGGQEYNLRSSTIDIPLIASFYKAIEISLIKYNNELENIKVLHDFSIKNIKENKNLILNSFPLNNNYFIVNFSTINKVKASVLIEYLSSNDIYVSSTSACNSKKEEPSYVVESIYNDLDRASNTIRISFTYENSVSELEYFFKKLNEGINNHLWR